MKKPKKAKADKVLEATFPLEMDLKPHEDRIRAVYRKLDITLEEKSLPILLEGTWAENLTNAQLADLVETIRALFAANSTINAGLWELRKRLLKRPEATRVSTKEAKLEALILDLPDPS
jgi:hypothetical protein